MEFLAKVAATLLTALAAFAANLTPSPAIPVAAAAKVDQPAVTAQLHAPETTAIESECHQFEEIVLVTMQGGSAHIELLIVSSDESVVAELFDLSSLLDASWSPKSNAIVTLPWYVKMYQHEDLNAFLARYSSGWQQAY